MAKPKKKRSFHQELVLNQWMMSFFKGGTLHALKERLLEDRHEGIDEDGQTGFFHELHHNLFEVDLISVRVDPMLRFGLDLVARKQHISISDAVVHAVNDYLEKMMLTVKMPGQMLSMLDTLWSEYESERIINITTGKSWCTAEDIYISHVIFNLERELNKQCPAPSCFTKNSFYAICDKYIEQIKMISRKKGNLQELVNIIIKNDLLGV